nr:MAG TPA: minor capsid protein [Caudoviricetes sp.]
MGKFKVNDDQMTLASGMVGDIYEQMAQELMFNLIKRIKQRGSADLQREPWLWQLEKLNDMHMLNEQNVKYILEQTGIAQDLFDKIIKNEGLKVYKNTQEQLAEELVKNPPHNDVRMALESYAQQAFRDVNNLVNQSLLSNNFAKNPIMKTYQSIIETAVAEVISGVKTADQAINDTVMKWLAKGFPSDFVDKAGRQWNIDSYARMVTQSTAFRVYNDMKTRASEELGVETFYYSKHGASRPACAPIQGKVVTKGQSFYSETLGYRVESLKEHGWGTSGGALGANCKHYLTPFIIGVNNLPNIPEHLKDITPKQAIENGRKQAQQRAYERAIKDDKYKLQAAKLLEDEQRIAEYKNKLAIHRSSLNDLLKENDFLHRDSTRERVYKNGKAQEYAKNFNKKQSA